MANCLVICLMDDQDWKELDLSLFSECSHQLKFDEFIQNEDFNSKSAMNSLEVAMKKLDSHLHAEGEYSLDDLVKSGHVILDEDATVDDVIAICSKFLTIQSLRIDGYHFLLTIMTSVYINKNYQIKNPLLKFMFKAFSVAVCAVESFANTNKIGISCWAHFRNFEKYIDTSYSIDEVKKELMEYNDLPKALRDIANFELQFASFLMRCESSTTNKNDKNLLLKADLPEVPEFPSNLSESGIAKYLYYRDYSPLNPTPKPLSASAEQAHQTFVKLFQEVQEAKQSFSEMVFDLEKTIKKIVEWNESGPKISLARFIAYSYCCISYIDKQEFKKKIQIEFNNIHLPVNFFMYKEYNDFEDLLYDSYICIIQNLFLPIPAAHSFLLTTGSVYWSYIQRKGLEIYEASVPVSLLPKCASDDFKQIVSLCFPLWSTQIASLLLEIYVRWGFLSEIYSPKDYHIGWYLFEVAYRTLNISFLQRKVLDAIYKVHKSKKKKAGIIHTNEIKKNLLSQKNSPEQTLTDAKSELFSAYFYSYKLFKKLNSIKANCGPFFNEKGVFETRQSIAAAMFHLSLKTYNEFKESMEYNPFDINSAKKEVLNHFSKAKEHMSQYIKMTQKKDKESTEIMRSIIMNSVFFNKFKEGDRVDIVFKNHFLYPLFEISQ